MAGVDWVDLAHDRAVMNAVIILRDMNAVA
jgi:hypothetical protein